ncbi:phosphate ABC transporter substrate-binding/OmpA family protein [Lysobacter hankyongensis]|uniref:OmpA-like domain-containing protein n=1 Tax=Lysobacter hankyongensis TaxID=1176535 RepID=A0ABP9AVL9_9GAMM
MAVKLTPFAKLLIGAIVLVGSGSVLWNLYKNRKAEGGDEGSAAVAQAEGGKTSSAGAYAGKGDGPLGSAGNPLKVSIVSFHGYAPALVANGQSLKTRSGSIFDKEGLNVEFVIQDDIPTIATIFEAGTAQCVWRTSDFWAQEQPNLRNSGHDAKAVMIVDNTRGADAIIARDPSIRKVEDLAGKKVALLQFTPSHGMTIDAVDNSSLSARRKQSIEYVFIAAEDGLGGVRAALESGSVDAAVLWDPDLSLALRATKGHVVYSTKTASNLIFDVIVCDQRVLDDAQGAAAVQKLVTGWMKGVDAAKADPDGAVDALVATEEFFTLLAKDEGKPFVKGLFDNLLWTGVADNARILGMSGGTNHYARVYQRFDQIYRAAGALANPKSPVIPPQDSFDTRFIRSLYDASTTAQAESRKTETFTEQAREEAVQAPAEVTKPVVVNFASGQAALTKRAEKTIDTDMVPFIENNGSAYFEISGNTDSTGNATINNRLSLARAEAVVDYLVKQWEFPRERFKIVGNGSGRPLCNESAPEAEGLTIDACRESNRSTRIAVYGARQ